MSYMPGHSTAQTDHPLEHPLQDIIFNAGLRRNVLLELRHALFVLDQDLIDKCNAFVETKPDTTTMLYQSARSYMTDNFTRRPLFIAVHAIDLVLANPNFLREFFLVLVVFLQFHDQVKRHLAPHTLEPVFRRFFSGFYDRFRTFMPGSDPMQSVDEFIRSEFSLLLMASSTVLQ